LPKFKFKPILLDVQERIGFFIWYLATSCIPVKREKGMVQMKRIALLMIIALLLAQGSVFASEYRTFAVIHVTIISPGGLSLDLGDDVVSRGIQGRDVEAFSTLKESGITVDKIAYNDETLWRFTKTE